MWVPDSPTEDQQLDLLECALQELNVTQYLCPELMMQHPVIPNPTGHIILLTDEQLTSAFPHLLARFFTEHACVPTLPGNNVSLRCFNN